MTNFNISIYTFLKFALVLSMIACGVEKEKGHYDYLFVGHTYDGPAEIDRRIEKLKFSAFDQIWLGGDICSETTREKKTLDYIDDVFDIGSPSTHWALGNHDVRNGNQEWISEYTKRPSFYTTSFNGITLMVLNTSLSPGGDYDTAAVVQQFEMIEAVCDSITNSSHMVVLTHNVVWGEVEQNVLRQANTSFVSYRFQFFPNRFYLNAIYPMFKKVQDKGIQVIHIGGDFGQKASSYEGVSADGVQFLGSGILGLHDKRSRDWKDQYLVLHHDSNAQKITWTFHDL